MFHVKHGKDNMTNKEKLLSDPRLIKLFEEELIDCIMCSLAIHKETKEICRCRDFNCGECLFHDKYKSCTTTTEEWLDEEVKDGD